MGFSTGKRKSRNQEEEEDTTSLLLASEFPMDELNDDVLERVLSWLPTSCFFRMNSVCKRWRSSQTSKSFKLACSLIPTRDPWFFMIDDHDSTSSSSSFVFDSTENTWKNLSRRDTLLHPRRDFIPVASSGGLLCFRCSISGDFLLRNPLTGSSRDLPSPISQDNNNNSLQAVAMTTTVTTSSYKLVTISGEIPNLSFKIYDSNSDSWSKDQDFELLAKNNESSPHEDESDADIVNGTVYFLSKTGNVVVASNNLQRSPSKQYSSVITVTDDAETVYFLSSYGTIVACDLTKRRFTELPKLLPPFLEYSIDLVECNGTMYVILLSEFFESASLRIWRLDDSNRDWVQVGMLPPALSHELYGKKGDVNCVGGVGNKILVCFNASLPEVYCRYFVYDLVEEEWSELPRCFKDGEAVDFVSALSFQPRIEATV
ncbi:PREDICTED: F-box only protein 13-like [Camelina sativa]|uniref:F-box only protein 13-like n=1 Tax=Camelina sativa TaxID=90675 RepID=A0ABM0UW97_CAMSA|nr:PREDICTED: F-box only protein 13-like [Camelina sativa]